MFLFSRRQELLPEILDGGGIIDGVQVYTIARRPAEDIVSPLDNGEVDRIAELITSETGLRAEAFYGSKVEG